MTRWLASAASGCRAVNASVWRLPARILADPRLLILDEATSSLTRKSEALIQDGFAFTAPGTDDVPSSRTACRPSRAPIKSSCSNTARSSSAARTKN